MVLPIVPPERLTLINVALPDVLFVDKVPAIVDDPVTVRLLPAVSNVPCCIYKSPPLYARIS